MAHVPHVLLPQPWEGSEVPLPDRTAHHLARVLRRRAGDPVSYTDGAGALGEGRLVDGGVARGPERRVARPHPAVTVAVAAPRSADRARFVVEKLGELGVDRLVWLVTARGGDGAPREAKARAWAVAALEQSRGAHLLDVAGPRPSAGLAQPLWVADRGGDRPRSVVEDLVVAVGPEGGWAPGELPAAATLGLGERILRVETAAVTAAIIALQAVGRLPVPAPYA